MPAVELMPAVEPMPTVYACQFDCVWHTPDANHEAAAALLASRPIAPGSLIVLPEMFDVGFTMDAATACAAHPSTSAFLADLARRHSCTVIAGHAACGTDGRSINQASVFSPDGSSLARYTKCHGFTPAGEHESYSSGEGAILFEWAGLKMSPAICYDLRFPELFRAGVKLGAEAFVVLANWPATRVQHWVTLAKARAIENQAYVIAVNRCGRDPKFAYPGRSLIVDPKGEVIAEAGDGVEILAAEIDPECVRNWRRDFPALRDARFL